MLGKLGIIGCGKMGYALTKGISSGSEVYSAIYACDTSSARSDLFVREFGATPASPEELVSNADIVILAVKPNQVLEVLNRTAGYWNENQLLITIAAGIKTASIEAAVGKALPVVRVMPNTPCLVGEGASGISAGHYASPADIDMVKAIMDSVGISVIVDEAYMDAITALSGSGPAYAFLVVEAMMDAALQLGLSSDMSRSLVLQTIKGSIAMLEKTGEHPAVLKSQVTSPGGTTIAGLRKLEAGGIRETFFAALEKACQRSKELGS